MTFKKHFTPIEISNHTFRTSVKGFNKDDVKLFLNAVADSYQELLIENSKLVKEVERLKSILDEYQKRENLLKDALYLAQKTADDIKDAAEREAKSLLKEAEVKADSLLKEAMLKANKIERETIDLKLEREKAIEKLKDFLLRLEHLIKATEEKKREENVEVIKGK